MEYEELARARSHRGEIVLRHRRSSEDGTLADLQGVPNILELRVNGVFVMDSAENSSELALANLALAMCATPHHVLVGGLGLGFTTHEVLSDHRVQHAVVAEIEEALVGWFRDGTVPHGPGYLADERLSVCVADVQQVVAEASPATFDLVLLDVDNGPTFLVYEENHRIYEKAFLEQTREAMRDDAVLVVWSSSEDIELGSVLAEVFGNALTESHPVVLQGREDSYWLHIARRSGTRQPDEGEKGEDVHE